jgi:hypothetical protein
MILIVLLAAAQAAAPSPATAPAAGPVDAQSSRFARCAALTQSDPAAARAEAGRWRISGGRYFARQCAGLAFAAEKNWPSAAAEFEEAAREAQIAKDTRAANYWAQAGNAWLASGQPACAQ